MITLMHEILARRVAGMAGLRMFDPPIPRLQPITEIALWSVRCDADPGRQWLRRPLDDQPAAPLPADVPAGETNL